MILKRNPFFDLQLNCILHSKKTSSSSSSATTARKEKDALTRSSSRSSASERSNTTSRKNASASSALETSQQQTQAGTTATEALGTVKQFGQEQLTQLQDLLSSFAKPATDAAAGITGLVDQLQTRAGDAAGAIDIGAIIGESRRKGELAIGQQESFLGAQAGSRLNTLVQGEVGESRASLESQLAGQEATLQLQQREAVTGELLAALEASGIPAQQLTGIAEVLKGAETSTTQAQNQTTATTGSTTGSQVGTTQSTEQESTVQNLTKLLSEVGMESTAITELIDSITNTKGSSKSSRGLLGGPLETLSLFKE